MNKHFETSKSEKTDKQNEMDGVLDIVYRIDSRIVVPFLVEFKVVPYFSDHQTDA